MGLEQLASRVVALPTSTLTGLLAAPEQARAVAAEVHRLGTQVWGLVGRAQVVLDRGEALLDEVAALVAAVAALRVEAEAVVAGASGVVADGARAVGVLEEQARRVQLLLDVYEPDLRALAPVVGRAAAEVTPRPLANLADALGRLPELLELAEPALRNLAGLGPELKDVTDKVENVGQIVEGIPGAGVLRRRAQHKDGGD